MEKPSMSQGSRVAPADQPMDGQPLQYGGQYQPMGGQPQYQPQYQAPVGPVGQVMQQQNVTQVIVNQPEAKNNLILGPVSGHRDWSSGICGCFEDCNSCFMQLCLGQCFVCQLAGKQGDCCCMPCCIGYPLAVLVMRTRIRTLGGIRGSICEDCVCVACCYDLVVCQLAREMNAMGI